MSFSHAQEMNLVILFFILLQLNLTELNVA